MSSIRSILDKLAIAATFYGISDKNTQPSVDQALKEIEEAIDVVKPNKFRNSAMTTTETNNYGAGYNHALEIYQSNLKELFK